MQFDLTNLTAGHIVVITVIGTVVVALISALGALVTALVNARSTRRLEYMKVVRATKTRQARLIRRVLNRRIKYLLALRAGKQPLPLTDVDESTFLPPFIIATPAARA